MNPIALLRSQAGVTQKTLAAQAKTSQPTIALYESGSKSPTWTTLQKLASSQGLHAVVSYLPRMTREDERSLSYHAAIVQVLRKDPSQHIKRAKRLLSKMSAHHPEARSLFRLWHEWLNLPTEDMISRILDTGVLSREMRHISPFAGILKPHDRARILKRFRKEYNS